jgi:hypothetical protein
MGEIKKNVRMYILEEYKIKKPKKKLQVENPHSATLLYIFNYFFCSMSDELKEAARAAIEAINYL